MSADAKLKAYIDRILRCREAEDAAKDDTKAVYAELAGDGYEKSVVGQVVTFLRKREKDGDKLSEQSAKFDLYLEAYERPSHAHTRVRAAEASANPELLGGFPVAAAETNAEETGENDSVNVVTGGESAEMDRATEGSFETGSEAAEKGREAIPAGPEGVDLNHAGASESLATHSPETATKSLGDGDGSTVEQNGAATAGTAVTAGETAPHSDQPLTGGDHEEVDDHRRAMGEGEASAALPIKPKHRLRPNCLDRSNCKSGSVDHCWSCKKAMAEKSEVAA